MSISSDPAGARALTLRERPALVFGALGLVSGALSAFIGYGLELDWLQPIASLFFMKSGVLPVGVFFATAIGLAVWLIAQRLPVAILAFLATLYAWSGALHIAIRLQRNMGDDPHLIAGSLLAGAFGAGFTHLGVSASLPALRSLRSVLLTSVVGAAMGMLFYLGERQYIDPRALFLLWQPVVAFVIGLAAGRPQRA